MAKRKGKPTQITKITKEVAAKVLEVVDAGLSNGVGENTPGRMCIEAAVCYAMGEPHTDNPKCVAMGVRNTKININDWGGWRRLVDPAYQGADTEKVRLARSKAMRRLAIAQLGSKGVISEQQWADAVLDYLWNKLPGFKRAYEKERKRALALLASAAKDLKAGRRVELELNVRNPKKDIDPDSNLMDGCKTVNHVRRLCEDLVKILIKLRSPGTKFLYLTERKKRK